MARRTDSVPFSKLGSQSRSNHSENLIVSNKEEMGIQEKDGEHLRIRREYRSIRDTCFELGIKYDDVEFPPDLTSILGKTNNGEMKSVECIASWQRPENIRLVGMEDYELAEDWVLIRDPSDIQQGYLGDCWFIAALALVAERTELLSNIFISKQYNPVGVYALRLFKDGQWKGVIIDDLFPCNDKNRLLYAKSSKKQLWVPLVEKAMSKLHGSYASLQAGNLSDALNYLTGFVSDRIDLNSINDHDLLWAKLLSFHDSNFLMGVCTAHLDDCQAKDFKDEMGLVANHMYSLLQVVCLEGHRLVQLRNPWGQFTWKGDWSDGSSLWTESMMDELIPFRKEEGIFWMSFEDFVRYFTALEVCKVRQNWSSYFFDGILPPYADPDCQPCFELICGESCEVDISLYQSSKRNARETVRQTDIGFMILKTNGDSPSSNGFKLMKPVRLEKSARKRIVSCNLMLKPGSYILVPFSFGHWTSRKKDETFYNFGLTIHSSRNLLKCSTVLNQANILADALISCCSKKFLGKNLSLEKQYQFISLMSMNLGMGDCLIARNYSEGRIVELEVNCKVFGEGEVTCTRNGYITKDEILPKHCQVIQVMIPKGVSCSYSYNIRDFLELPAHRPAITARIAGLHEPRPI